MQEQRVGAEECTNLQIIQIQIQMRIHVQIQIQIQMQIQIQIQMQIQIQIQIQILLYRILTQIAENIAVRLLCWDNFKKLEL